MAPSGDNAVAVSTSGSATATPESGSEGEIVVEQVTEENEGTGTVVKAEETQPETRQTWGSTFSYLLTLTGYAVGFGNIWRFPYVMRDNGGFAFLIPYCLMLAVVGIPTFFLELAVGQRRRKGVCYAWNEISPKYGGLGIACGWLCFFSGLYYNTLLAYCTSYLVDSLKDPLPWQNCTTVGPKLQQTECETYLEGRASKYYWFRGTLDISTDVDTFGNYNWYLFLYHVISWAVVWLILWKGTQVIGKVVYFTALFPYVVLVCFFIANFCIDVDKAWLGAWRLLKPDWMLILSPIVWLKAGSQIFFSLGLGMGCLVVFASYSPARNNCHKDAVVISLINCATSLFAAFVVFPMIGAMGYRNYEICFKDISRALPEIGENGITLHNHYDIYFVTNATSWEDVYRGAYVTGRFGIGEMKEDEEKANFENPRDADEKIIHFRTIIDPYGDRVALINEKVGPTTIPPTTIQTLGNETINSTTTQAPTPTTRTGLLPSFKLSVRDCSIGQEATASGGGSSLIFVGFTEAVKYMPWPNFFSALFFFMMFQLGIDSGFGTVEGAVVAFEELTKFSRAMSTAIVCGVSMILALLLFPFGFGSYVLEVLDVYTANWTLMVVVLVQCMAVSWSYGLAKFSYDVLLMTGSKPNLFMLLCWKYITPGLLLLMLVGSIAEFIYDSVVSGGIKYPVFRPEESPDRTGEIDIPWPIHTLIIGFLLLFFCMAWLPIHTILRGTKYEMLGPSPPGDFPEEELRAERQINVTRESEQFTRAEKMIMGEESLQNLQDYRDKIPRKGSAGSGSGSTTSSIN